MMLFYDKISLLNFAKGGELMQVNETLKGVIESVVYRNEKNDYTVLDVLDSENNLVTCVGSIPMPAEGERVVLVGYWSYHKEFGRQFSFSSFEKTLPEGIEGIIQYLSSRTVKGVGPITALKIVNRFGENTFDVMENHPEWLADIPGITMKKAAAISESFREQSGIRGVMMFCKDFIGSTEVTRVYKALGTGAIGIIKENPYILCEGECGIPFDKADALASSLGVSPDAEERVLSGMKYILAFNANTNGHTCLPLDKLLSASEALLGIPFDSVKSAGDKFIIQKKLSFLRIEDAVYVMTNEVADAEEYIASKISELDKSVKVISVTDIAYMIRKSENDFGIEYADLQKSAIFEALCSGIMILTGGPGTGKTTVVKALISIFKSFGMSYVLCAPTGRAAKRMSDATSVEAKTIHRMLEMERADSSKIKFGRNARNPIDEDVVIVDEASMMDLSLFDALLSALNRGARLILIGDVDQLPSVGAGNVFSDLISSNAIKTIRLNEIFRQSKESLIITNAHRINIGEAPILTATDNDFFFVKRAYEREIPETVASLIVDRLPKTYGKDIVDKIQVITPSKKGAAGIEILNPTLQAKINPPMQFKREKLSHGVIFREGDRVMQLSNNYDIEWTKNGKTGNGIFNGDIGVIEDIDLQNEEMKICFDDRCCMYSFELLDELDLAYAITVHKSQGSEYPVVIIPMYSHTSMLMTRNLLYTAVTRAKNMVLLVGNPEIPERMVGNNREILRYTTLRERILRENMG